MCIARGASECTGACDEALADESLAEEVLLDLFRANRRLRAAIAEAARLFEQIPGMERDGRDIGIGIDAWLARPEVKQALRS
jgi:hypothetical protein